MGEQITRDMLEPYLDAHTGNRVFADMLTSSATHEHFVRAFAQYIAFNAVFGSGVASLAGKIASMQDLFIDSAEPVLALADRSSEVASRVFFAAIDEFDDRGTLHLDTHRTLAQATLKGIADFWKITPEILNRLSRPSRETQSAMREVQDWYGVSLPFVERGLFNGIGFHMGSEILADGEFNILDRVMRARFPELVASLEATNVVHVGNRHNAYYWVHIHGTGGVEADHFERATEGANLALTYYDGSYDKEEVVLWILDGVQHFAKVQTEFMQNLAKY